MNTKKNRKQTDNILEASGLSKIYTRGSENIHAVNDISLSIKRGEFVSFIGPSGSGKTTLINILGCLDNPTSGRLNIAGNEIFPEDRTVSERELTHIRRTLFGYIFQNFYLIPTLTVYENVTVPLTFYRKNDAQGDIDRILKSLGIDRRRDHLPGQLSGGEMQRVAIARALINKPGIILADEPTGNLDTKRSTEIGNVLRDLNSSEGITIIMVTHNLELAGKADRIIELEDGNIKKKRGRY